MSNATPVTVPRESANDEYVVLVSWLAEDHSAINQDAPIAVVESMKTTYEIAAPAKGYLIRARSEGDQIDIGDVLAYVADEPEFQPAKTDAANHAPPAAAGPSTVFTRKAERLIEEQGLDRADFESLDVVKERDVLAALKKTSDAGGNRSAESPDTASIADESVIVTEVSATKKFEIDYLTRSSRAVLYSKVVRAVPLDPVAAKVKRLAAEIGAVTLGECVMRACALTLKQFPEFNACHVAGKLHQYKRVNLAFAINVNQRGLKTPVIHDADQLDQTELSKAAKTLALKYLRDELVSDDLREGTFTVTDLSSAGVTQFAPVINDRQAAILGICAPPPKTDWFNLALAFDHRVTDGMAAAQFLAALEEFLLAD